MFLLWLQCFRYNFPPQLFEEGHYHLKHILDVARACDVLSYKQWSLFLREQYHQQHADGTGVFISAQVPFAQTLVSSYRARYRRYSQFVIPDDIDPAQVEPAFFTALYEQALQNPGLVSTSLPRFLSPRECARLQGFPDWYDLGVDEGNGRLYKQIGNAVVPPIIREIVRPIADFLGARPLDRDLFEQKFRASVKKIQQQNHA